MKPLVYSYIRFSTPEQANGDSLRRQTEAAVRFAASNGMELDEGLTMRDLGRSAYAGHHVTEGALGTFLAACDAGLVPEGSILVVEAVDRLTRLDHLEAVALLGRLLKHVHLHVVQLGRTFTNEIVRHDMGAIFTLIGAITLGHQESQQKSHRVSAAWAAKRRATKNEGHRLTTKAPAWLRPTSDGFEAIPERSAIVQRIFEQFSQGESQQEIVRRLNEEKVPLWGRGMYWSRSYVCKILRSESVVGVLVMGKRRKLDRERTIVESVEGYYPAIVDPTIFSEAGRRLKSGTRGRPASRNPMQGILRCPYCGGVVIRETKGPKSRPKLVCGAVRNGAGKIECASVREHVETYWPWFRGEVMKMAKRGSKAVHPRTVNSARKKAEQKRENLEEARESMGQLKRPSAFLIQQLTKLEAEVNELEAGARTASRDANLGWDNLVACLSDESSDPAEVSARLRVVFPDGIPLEPGRGPALPKLNPGWYGQRR